MKKHKKHKGDRKDRYDDSISDKPPALKLILKVGGGSSSTPEHCSDSPIPPSGPSNYSVATLEDESSASLIGISPLDVSGESGKHKKAKKKKKKKDRDRDKHERKHKHHHKERKKRTREESSQDDVSLGDEESTNEIPAKKPALSSPIVAELLSTDDVASATSTEATKQQTYSGGAAQEDSQASREPRTCVLKHRQEHTPLYKLLDYLTKTLEKKDPQQFFAWPVTDNIAPGYSAIITQPMDFSTIRQKNEDGLYNSLPEFMEDFKRMCENAMVYNQQETVYYRSAKKLLHAGLKFYTKDKLKSLLPSLPFLSEVPTAELGFELHTPEEVKKMTEAATAQQSIVSAEATAEVPVVIVDSDDHKQMSDAEVAKAAALEESRREAKRKSRIQRAPLTRFEAIPDDLTPEEILAQAKQAAKNAADKLAAKKPFGKMGFLRTNKDGTTSLAILCGNTGVLPGTKEQAISLGSLTGKLPHGTGQLAGFREDKRNMAKTVKPLYYGAFGSYAPSYDSTFANLSKEESDLVYSTYGDETGYQYAESILDFSRDSDYTLRMVDDLLDLLSGGEHSKTMTQLGTKRRRPTNTQQNPSTSGTSTQQNNKSETETPPAIDMDALKGLAELGIDTGFLDNLGPLTVPSSVLLTTEAVQASLDQTSQLIGQLQKVQRDRLSQPPPPHLSLIPGPSESEVQLAEKITDNLTDLAKQVTPEAIAPACVVRKAMGVDVVNVPAGGAPPTAPRPSPTKRDSDTKLKDGAEKSNDLTEVPDLESELREFLENTEPTLSSSPLQDEDRTIEEILSES